MGDFRDLTIETLIDECKRMAKDKKEDASFCEGQAHAFYFMQRELEELAVCEKRREAEEFKAWGDE